LTIATITLALMLNACSQSDVEITPATITIMTMNFDNLFDNKDDAGKNDFTFLPIGAKQNDAHRATCGEIKVERWRNQCLEWDWNDDILDRKLTAIAGAILAANSGHGPDIIAIQEVENLAILERLRTDHLGDAGYLPAILIEGHDLRGIDVAFLSRLPLAGEPMLHPFPEEGIEKARYDDTRGVLEATFRLPNDGLLTGFAVHFPAPFHPTEMRVIAYEQLNELRTALPLDRMAFAAGDFNTTAREDRELNMLQHFARPLWIVANDQGCSDCEGSYYYAHDDSWSYLDLILWSPAKKSGEEATWTIRAGSFAIANEGPGQSTEDHRPAHFELPQGDGVSDHWPVIVTLELK
jgi:endonuclease/exonuclease/phosphatase family metal-dependent hydrolase